MYLSDVEPDRSFPRTKLGKLILDSSFTRPAISNIVEIHRTILCITQMYDVFTPENGVCFTIMLGSALATFYAHITTQVEDTYVCI